MNCCKIAEQETKDTIKIVALTTLVSGWLTNDFRLNSLLNNFWQISKYVLKNNENVRINLVTTILCKLGL